MNLRTSVLSLVAVVILASAAMAGVPPKTQSVEIGKMVPDFTLTSSDGKKISLSDYKGKVVVLQWSNHVCPYIKFHEGTNKTTQKLNQMFAGKDVVWLAIDSSNYCEEKKDGINEFRMENDILYPTLLDASGKVGRMYGAKTTPHVFVIDQKGKLVYQGAIDDDQTLSGKEGVRNYVAEAVAATLKGSTVPVSKTKSYGCSVKYKK